MDGHVGKLIDSVGSIFRGSDILPWCDRDIIAVSPSSPLLFSPRKLGARLAAGSQGEAC
jgi:hypothetical protein